MIVSVRRFCISAPKVAAREPALRSTTLALATAVLAACGDSVAPDPNAITVAGVVVNEYLQLQPRVMVVITGHPAVTTDDSGRFSVSGVKKPYDLTTGLFSEYGVLVYAGLGRGDPLIVVPASPFSTMPHGYVEGTLSGGAGFPEPENHRASVFFESPDGTTAGSAGGDGGYVLAPHWRGPGTTTGTLHGLQWQFDPATGLPLVYKGYGKRPGVVLPENPDGRIDVQLAPIETGSVSGSVAVPDGFTLSAKALGVRFVTPVAPAFAWALLTDTSSTGTFTYQTPNSPGATFVLSARAVSGEAFGEVVKTESSANVRDVALTIPGAPVLVSPEDGATGVLPSTPLHWTPTPRAIYLVSMRYEGPDSYSPPPPSIYVFTTDSTAAVPDLSGLGMWLYPGTRYRWQVMGWGPFGSVDEIAAKTWFVPQGDGISIASVSRQFTFAR